MTEKEMVTTEECTFEVQLMARRAALLHYFFSKTMIDELGEEEGKKLIHKAIGAYGEYCGNAVRKGVEEMGLPITDENFGKVRDLPRFGWKMGVARTPEGEDRMVAEYCPLAGTFMEFGDIGKEIGRLYCYVDQAKYEAYNPDAVFIHTKNVLDDDGCCEFLIQPRES
ncbi:MAG: L-2-amino-thiazoline-4-carboxylic acid hydrolase [Anaerolineaceae bacterium]|nr:L-2-amino-thiazoline-4-carboxylic acid hydrolase [Anaerolineaceae bacterium]